MKRDHLTTGKFLAAVCFMGAFGIGDQNDLAAARRNLLQAGECLLENAVERRNDDDRHLLVDEGYWAVLSLPRGIASTMLLVIRRGAQ